MLCNSQPLVKTSQKPNGCHYEPEKDFNLNPYAKGLDVVSSIRLVNGEKWMGINATRGADEGTRTHTLTHENLNLACLPIPPHLRV